MSSATFTNSRTLPYPVSAVFRAHSDPKLLAQWWGPNGFTNTFERFEFKTNGLWTFTMHGPDGQDYANENKFSEIVENEKIVVEHIVIPIFTLTITLTAVAEGTRIDWVQALEDAEIAKIIREKFPDANEQNLDRLHGVLANMG